jgi:hypothetical protein
VSAGDCSIATEASTETMTARGAAARRAAVSAPARADVEHARGILEREQLQILARVTSSATRLVDAIFLTHDAARDH